MIFQTIGERTNPAILFFHAMGINKEDGKPVYEYLKDKYYFILPTSTVYCEKKKYRSKEDEIRQVEEFLEKEGIKTLSMVLASSIGANLAIVYLSRIERKVEHVFSMADNLPRSIDSKNHPDPHLYFAIKSLHWTKGGSQKDSLV